MTSKFSYLKIFLTCVTILYVELFLIRLISTEINIFAYLQNSILIICFLGLGMGLYRGNGGPSIEALILPLCVVTLLCLAAPSRQALSGVSYLLSIFHDFVVWDQADPNQAFSLAAIGYVTLAFGIVFLIAALCWEVMTPLGVQLAQLLSEAPSPIRAYSWDIAGSALGILCFTALSLVSAPPYVWFLILAGLLLIWTPIRRTRSFVALGLTFAAASASHLYDRQFGTSTIWSPYQKLSVSPMDVPGEWRIQTNNAGFQQIENNIDDSTNGRPIWHQYSVPALLAGNPRRVLVVGAGTGNDLAGVLRHSQASIIAVEIDPALVALGDKLHPEHPYQNPRVTLRVDDARAAFETLPPNSFDLIVFGLLDSHTTPNLSNARLDNFVYTIESITAAKRLLSDRGVMVIIFAPQRPYISGRLHNTLLEAFSTPPRTVLFSPSPWGWGGVAFISGNSSTISESLKANPGLDEFIKANEVQISGVGAAPTTDRWPYLYIEAPSIPALFYFLGLLLIALWCRASRALFGTVRFPGLRSQADRRFFLLGVGFSAAQVFAVNNASILFGSTWIVNSAVIFGTLALILCANFLATVLPAVSLRLVAAILVIVCLSLAALPLSWLLGASFLQKFFAAAALSGLPMLLSGIIFARAFEASPNRSQALGANLLGAMVGGILQLGTFLFGIPSLMVFSALAYALVAMLRDDSTARDSKESVGCLL